MCCTCFGVQFLFDKDDTARCTFLPKTRESRAPRVCFLKSSSSSSFIISSTMVQLSENANGITMASRLIRNVTFVGLGTLLLLPCQAQSNSSIVLNSPQPGDKWRPWLAVDVSLGPNSRGLLCIGGDFDQPGMPRCVARSAWGQPQTELTIRDPAKNGGISCVRVWLQDLVTDLSWRDPANAYRRDRSVACVWTDPAEAVVALEASLVQRTGQPPDERAALLEHLAVAHTALGISDEGDRSSWPSEERAGTSGAWADKPFDIMPSCTLAQWFPKTVALRL